MEPTDRVQELQGYIAALVQGEPGINVLQKLALLCLEKPVTESPSSPPSPGYGLPNSPSPFIEPSRSSPSLYADMWDKDKNFERLFNALINFLEPSKVSHSIYVRNLNESYPLQRLRKRLNMASSSYGRCWRTKPLT